MIVIAKLQLRRNVVASGKYLIPMLANTVFIVLLLGFNPDCTHHDSRTAICVSRKRTGAVTFGSEVTF
jgi:hypothetical protein